MFNNSAITYLSDPPNAYLLTFSKFKGGALDAIRRIPRDQPGIYFWYRTFEYPTDESGFSESLRKDLLAPKFPTRVGQIQPYYEVSLASNSNMSTKKANALDKALTNTAFRLHIRQLLNLGLLLQAPLYIGKSRDIRRRMEEHLSEGSALCLRLEEHGLRIADTALLVVPLNEAVDLNLENMDDELLYEEIFSRLFNPIFNLRIG